MAVVLPFVATFVDKGVKQAKGAIEDVEATWGKFGGAMKKMAVPAAAVGTALGGALMNAKKQAGEAAKSQKILNQAMSKAGYAENAAAANEYARELSKATGIDQNSIRIAQARLASNEDIAASTDVMGKATKLAADMAAQGFGDMEKNALILAKGLEDPAKGMMQLNRMGITFSLEQQKAIKDAMKAGDQAMAQQLLISGVISEVGGSAEKNASSTAKMRAAYADLAIQIGSLLLPVFSAFAKALTGVINWLSQNIGVTKALIATIGGLVTIILGVNAAMKVWETGANAVKLANKLLDSSLIKNIATGARWIASLVAQKAASVAQAAGTAAMTVATKLWNTITRTASIVSKGFTGAIRGLNAAMKANPIGFVIGLIMALVTAFMYAWRNSETFRRIVTQAFNAVKDVAQRVFSAIASAIQPVIDLLSRIIGLAKNVAGAIGDVISKIPGLGKAAGAAASAGKSTRAGAMTVSGAAGGPAVVINVQGAVDPERTARQIRDILDGHDIRQGRLVTRAVAW